jgi:16S rRNA (guanine527-N7)-methyltransferase
MKTIEKYYPDLTDIQRKQLTELEALYKFWNEQINVISRKDTENFYERHVLHSMGIAKIMAFKEGTTILDIGTGGGFPGIPLAILFPNCHFTLVDSVGKKIKVVNEVAESLGLTNVIGIHGRAETLKEKFDFIVSRAVTAMPAFLYWTRGKFNKKSNNTLPNGILYLKGGDLKEELKSLKQKHKVIPLNKYFNEEFFETKKIVYVSGN